MSKRFIIEGQKRLSGRYPVQGNKNAALPLIAASLLAERKVRTKDMGGTDTTKEMGNAIMEKLC